MNNNGINANGKYFLFLLKLIALEKGIGCKLLAFCSIEAKTNSVGVAVFANCKKFSNLSLTSSKCVPIILEASV